MSAGPRGLSLEALDGVRRRWRFGDVSRLADFVPEVLACPASGDRPILLVPPRSSVAWESAAASWPGRVKVVGRPAVAVSRIAEDKIYVRQQMESLGIPVPEALVLAPGEISFPAIARRLGTPVVMQSPNGAGGQGTHLIENEAQLGTALRGQPNIERWLLSRFCGEVTINVAGVSHVDGVRLLPASVQASGIAEVGSGFGSYCGSDFGAAGQLPAGVLDQAYRHSARLGEWLRERGHLGLFGADIAVCGREIAFLEVNPRIQGSSWLLGKAQAAQGERACLEDHVRALLGAPVENSGLPAAVTGSHLLVRWTGPAGVVKRLPTEKLNGVSGLPGLGVTVLTGAILARLESAGSLVTPDGRRLTAPAKELLGSLHDGARISADS
jgi:formate-dependent phosphoribosylglycinamide formyltransferase (GAR transformylase)